MCFFPPYLVGGVSLLTIEADSAQLQNVASENEDVYVVALGKSRKIPKTRRKLTLHQEELPLVGGKEFLLKYWIVVQIQELRWVHTEEKCDALLFKGIIEHFA